MMQHLDHLINQLEELYNGDPWLDETFEKKFADLDAEQAFAQPAGCHSVAQLLSHLAEWRRVIMRRIDAASADYIGIEEDKNFPDNELLRSRGWTNIRADFQETHQVITSLRKRFGDTDLDTELPAGQTLRYYLEGLIHHDAYHMGQIGLVISMIRRGIS